MSADLEEQLRRHFAEDAAQITAPVDMALQVRRRARRQRRVAMTLSAAAAAAVGVLVLGLWPSSGPGPTEGPGAVSNQASSSGQSTTGTAASCVQAFSPQALAEAGFAFDGTVLAIDDSETFDFERRVTFEVHHWYAGQSNLTAAKSAQVDGDGDLLIDMPAPDGGGAVSSEGLHYAVGDRLLVSGALRDVSGGLQSPVAWSCGFTGTYDAVTSQTWQDAFTGSAGSEP